MKSKISIILVTLIGLVISSCGQEQISEATYTPLPNTTIQPTSTDTPIPTYTSTPIPVSSTYIPVPRWMILNRPFYSVEILGEQWNYVNDRWGDTYGCISYSQEIGTPKNFEQCFAVVINEAVSFEGQRDLFLGDGFETLKPQTFFGEIGQIALFGKRLTGDTKKVIEFFEIVGIGEYITLVELYIETDDDGTLQNIYENQVADIMDYVLQDSLHKSHLIPRPTATPLASNQQVFYDNIASKLISETQASEIYMATWVGEMEGSIDGTWESLGDRVLSNRTQVCRIFEDRTNADVLWVSFENCVVAANEFPFDSFSQFCTEPGDAVMESKYEYQGDFLICAHDYTDFYAFLNSGEFIFAVLIESRKIGDYQDAFTQTVDDFIYNVFMNNLSN